MRRVLLASGALGAVLCSAPAPASALEAPAPLSRDARVRVVAYDRDQVVQLHAAVGSTVRVEIAPDEAVELLSVSDQAVMSGEIEADVGVSEGAEGGAQRAGNPNAACDANMCRTVRGPVIYIKPLRDLEPQPLHLQTKRCGPQPVDGAAPKCAFRLYQFELQTRAGPLTEAAPHTVYAVRFDYPADRAAADRARGAAVSARARAAWTVRRAAAQRAAEEARVQAAEDLLRSQRGAVVNNAYTVRGDRAVLGAAR